MRPMLNLRHIMFFFKEIHPIRKKCTSQTYVLEKKTIKICSQPSENFATNMLTRSNILVNHTSLRHSDMRRGLDIWESMRRLYCILRIKSASS